MPLSELEEWYILSALQNTALNKEKKLKDITYEEVFGYERKSLGASSYAAIVRRMEEQAGGFDNLTSEQIEKIHEAAREEVRRTRKEGEV